MVFHNTVGHYVKLPVVHVAVQQCVVAGVYTKLTCYVTVFFLVGIQIFDEVFFYHVLSVVKFLFVLSADGCR